MQHSKMFDKIKTYYDDGRWPKSWVANAVTKGKITAAEYEEITGEPFPG